MLFKTIVTESKEVMKEIKLPHYSKDSIGTFYRINEDESVLRVSIGEYGSELGVFKKTPYGTASFLERALECKPCSAIEVEEAAQRHLKFVSPQIEELADSVP